MTAYDMIYELIVNETMSLRTAMRLLKEACEGEHIEFWQYEDLVEIAKKYGF